MFNVVMIEDRLIRGTFFAKSKEDAITMANELAIENWSSFSETPFDEALENGNVVFAKNDQDFPVASFLDFNWDCHVAKQETATTLPVLRAEYEGGLEYYIRLLEASSISIDQVKVETTAILLDGVPGTDPLWAELLSAGLFLSEGVEMLLTCDIDIYTCFYTFEILDIYMIESIGSLSFSDAEFFSTEDIVLDVLGEDLYSECKLASGHN